jgi:hypothetical protein
MLIVDDCTRWMDVSILKSKDQAAAAFAKFKVAAENKLGHKVKVLRSDRGFLETYVSWLGLIGN